ncbi:snRNA-activating protein complex subunit 4-like isoform X2 [Conger conger]|uniref:snRNA-activating protein complex subunit 4-like isoform X2 n=1 Tax=Conger conger TaxID=82655 RepID=UPI002A59F852|nr:snRNA-activating protein complex subunit 4-like isoform X2 [Conger conger]
MEDLAAKRRQIQKEITELELSLSQDVRGVDEEILSPDDENGTESIMESSGEDSDDEAFSLPPDAETCLQMNLVYQDVLEEKLTELERLLSENKEQQREVMVQVSGPTPQATTSGLPALKLFLGNFMKPYFKDKVTGLGPPANPETRDKMNMGTRTYDEMKIRRWEGWQKTLLVSSIVSDTMKRLLQPKLFKLEYLNEKMGKAEDMEKQILQKQINQIEREIDDISSLSEEQLMGNRHDDHDWEKISNIDFEGTRSADDIQKFWENYLHPSVNKSSWKEDEIEKLKGIVENMNYCKWDKIAEGLGTNRTAFMCLQTHQRYIHKGFKKKLWSKEEDQVLRELVEKMRIGNFIPYTQISYFMEGREAAQLVYRWTQVLEPSLRKGPWTKVEDEMLLKAVAKYGVRDWWKIRTEVPGRTDAQCRERYLDCLTEDVKKGRWSPEEEAMLIMLVGKYGAGRWAKIASEMPNRIDCQCLQKWKIMTGYPRMAKRWIKKEPPKKREKKRKKPETVKREDEEEDAMTSSEEAALCLSSDEELKDLDDDQESNLEMELREEYILPSMEKWIPKKSGMFPHLGLRAVRAAPAAPAGNKPPLSRAALGRPCSGSRWRSLASAPGARWTALDRFGCPLHTRTGAASLEQQMKEDQHSESDMITVSLSEVRNLLRWNGGSQMKQRCKLSRLPRRKANEKSRKKGTVAREGPGSVTHPSWRPRASVAHHVCSTSCTTQNDEVLLAITPWMGNLILPVACKNNERCKADMVREKSEATGLKSTPVFSLFLNILSIDAEGCKKVIEARRSAEIRIPRRPAVRKSLPSAPPRKRRVAEMLAEKREQERGNEAQDQKKSGLIMMISPPAVTTQPLLQGIAAPIVSAPDQLPTAAKGKDALSTPKTARSQKRTPKPKAAPKAKLPGKSQNNKQAQNISQVPLPPQSHISWILTPHGLLPVTGLGIPIAPQAPPVEINSSSTGSRFRRLKPKPDNSLTFYINRPLGAQSPSSVLQIGPGVCVPAGLPSPSAVGERTVFSLAPALSASPGTHANVACHNIDVSFTAPGGSVTPVRAAVSAGASVAESAGVLSQVTPGYAPALTYSQALPTLQVCRPQAPHTTANASVNPATAPTKPASLSQQVFSPATKPALSVSPRPEQTLSIDPGLISAEDASHVAEWMRGKGGVKLPPLDVTLPYLPPFVSSLSTLMALLKCKSHLERCASSLLSSGGESSGDGAAETGIRRLVAERLSSNPAYLLLKARFLSCFSLPAFLATVPPHREDEDSAFHSEDVGFPLCEGMPKEGLLRTDGKGAEAGEFSGIATQQRTSACRTDAPADD